ncbi:MAG: hypothetical protein ILP19_01660 [Oscillospiraceae bacterium]|nr:hypothetical protein [Oscillospiraceae bacterium]
MFDTKLIFHSFTDYDEGREKGKLARLSTADSEIPVNIYAEPDSDFGLCDGDMCNIEIYGVASDLDVYTDEDAYLKAETNLAPVSMIPMGTFPLDDDDDFAENPRIIFTGKVIYVENYPDADVSEPNYCVVVETLEMNVILICRYDQEINKDNIVYGVAWLYGTISSVAENEGEDDNG